MIEVYSWATPNGHKVHIMLEECGLPYRAHPGQHRRGRPVQARVPGDQPEQQDPGDRRSRRPDGKPISLFESGAILLYLAAKTGTLPARRTLRGKYDVLQWLMFQMGGVGPMLGQAHHFRLYAPEKIPYAIDRYSNEAKRLYGVIDKRLGRSRSTSPATSTRSPTSPSSPGCARGRTRASSWTTIPHLKGWFDEIAARPAVQRGVEVLAALRKPITDDKEREVLFGATQYQRR